MNVKKSAWLTLLILFFLVPLICLAQAATNTSTTNVDIPPAAQNLKSLMLAALPFAIPALLAGLKMLMPRLPGFLLPVAAPLLGMLADWVESVATGSHTNPALALALGSAGVGVREVIDQLKQKAKTVNGLYVAIGITLFSFSTSFVVVSCASNTQTQNILYATTDSLGQAVDTAMQSASKYEFAKARTALGTNTVDEVSVIQWASTDPFWVDVQSKHAKYQSAYILWCDANAIAASNTNAVAVIQDPNTRAAALGAAADLVNLISQFVSGVPKFNLQ